MNVARYTSYDKTAHMSGGHMYDILMYYLYRCLIQKVDIGISGYFLEVTTAPEAIRIEIFRYHKNYAIY